MPALNAHGRRKKNLTSAISAHEGLSDGVRYHHLNQSNSNSLTLGGTAELKPSMTADLPPMSCMSPAHGTDHHGMAGDPDH